MFKGAPPPASAPRVAVATRGTGYALELNAHGPAAIPEPMHFLLRQLPLVGLGRLRLCTATPSLELSTYGAGSRDGCGGGN